MRNNNHHVEIENIEAMRLEQGIDDVELRDDIRRLRKGDLVNITILSGAKPPAGEKVSARIISIRGRAFRAELVGSPAARRLAALPVGSVISFTADHIHSIQRPAQQQQQQPAARKG